MANRRSGKEPAPVPRDTPEYHKGRAAYEAGDEFDDNPMKSGARIGWFTGWLDARTAERHGLTFVEFGISFP